MVIDLEAERERRKLERRCNPSLTRDVFEQAVAYAVVAAAFGFIAWAIVLSQPRG
jgi:hypothetical protein